MQNKQKIIMLLGAGQMQVPLIKKCKDLNLYTIVVDFDKNAPGFAYSDKNLIISTHDEEAIYKEAKKNKIDGILTTSDFPVRSVAYVAEKLGINGLSSNAAKISTNKYLLREELKNTQLSCPKYIKIENASELSKVDFFPAIIKPVDSSASRGVKKVNTKEELEQEYKISKNFSNSKKVIVEEYIEGKEFSVESVTLNGKTTVIAITDKKIIGKENGYFVEFSHIIQANINTSEKELIENTTIDLIDAIKLDFSSSHTEIILSNNKAYVIEIGARLGGDYIGSDLVYQSTGVDMLQNIINIAISESIDIKKKHKHFAAVQFITPANYKPAEEYIKKNRNSIIRYQMEPYKCIEIKNSLDRLGYIIVSSSSKDELNNILSKINDEY